MKTGLRLISYLKVYWKYFTFGFFAMLILTGINLSLPYIFGKSLIDQVFNQKGGIGLLTVLALGIIALFIIKGVFDFIQHYFFAFVGYRVVVDMRNQVYQHLQEMPISYHESQRIGELIARTMNDIGLIQNSVSAILSTLFAQSLLLIGTLVMLFTINWRLTLCSLIIFPIGALLISKIGQRVRRLSHRVQEKLANLTAILQENLTGIRIIKAFTMEKFSKERFNTENVANFQASMKSVKNIAILTPAVELLFVTALAFIIWYGGIEVLTHRLTVGTFLAFFGYIAMATTPLTTLTNNFNIFLQSLAAADRVFNILDLEITIKDKSNAITLPRLAGTVKFQDVTFAYRQDLPVLSHINFNVEPGEIVALVGPSGAGKTSLINLILRFYDPIEGKVLIDGYDIRDVQTVSLRSQIGLVPQESMLFGVSIQENIAYGKPGASEAEIIAAAKAANAHDFVMELPDGYRTLVGERGASLSGGQRQRISIARALLRDPRILILDEATSALDNQSEQLVQEALERLMNGRTTFIIAHRLSTIQHANRIIVLASGMIVEQGSHEDLINKRGLYKRLYSAGMDVKSTNIVTDEL